MNVQSPYTKLNFFIFKLYGQMTHKKYIAYNVVNTLNLILQGRANSIKIYSF